MAQLIAFHGDPAIKAKYLARVEELERNRLAAHPSAGADYAGWR